MIRGGEIKIPATRDPIDTLPLQPVVPPVKDTGENPFQWFYDRRENYGGINPTLVVRLAQYATGMTLNQRDLGNLYGWAQEETAR